jgi:hypothetical protein
VRNVRLFLLGRGYWKADGSVTGECNWVWLGVVANEVRVSIWRGISSHVVLVPRLYQLAHYLSLSADVGTRCEAIRKPGIGYNMPDNEELIQDIMLE